MHIECMVMHDVQNEFLLIFYQLGTLSPLPSGEKEVSQTPHWLLNSSPLVWVGGVLCDRTPPPPSSFKTVIG